MNVFVRFAVEKIGDQRCLAVGPPKFGTDELKNVLMGVTEWRKKIADY